MCGIAGILRLDEASQISEGELAAMALRLAERGPDAEGIYLDPATGLCGLAHRRLSVIDLTGGAQPMSSPDGRYTISYNGECYNFRELRGQLRSLGHAFTTACDTEVVLALYAQYGPQCVDHIRGMFAFAVWDRYQRNLFLARDRLGQKPLYYAQHAGRFLFASQCKALLETTDFPRRANLSAVGTYLLLGYVPAPHSAFADIQQLPPGHTLEIRADQTNQPQPRRYWTLPPTDTFAGTYAQATEQVRATLAEATRLRLVSDVPLGAFLSGGLDSTIIVGLMSQAAGEPVRTCAIGFDEKQYNELPYARIAAERFGCEHHEEIVAPHCADDVMKLLDYYDDPFADSSALPTRRLAQMTRRHVTVALSGDGGDECFGGYDRYRAMILTERIGKVPLLRWLARRRFWQNLGGSEYRGALARLKRLLAGANLPAPQRYLNWLALFNPELLQDIAASDELTTGADQFIRQQWQPAWTPTDSPLAQALRADMAFYLPGDLNCKTDRAGMSVSLEVRCPFEDHKLVELAASLPTAWRVRAGSGKRILRQACSDLLPEAIRNRPKRGFGVPVGRWFRRELRPLCEETVLSPRARQRGYFRADALENLWRQHQQGRADHGHRLWALLMLELWARRYLDN